MLEIKADSQKEIEQIHAIIDNYLRTNGINGLQLSINLLNSIKVIPPNEKNDENNGKNTNKK